MKNYILPAVLLLIGTGTAFATQKAKSGSNKLAAIQGYIFNSATNKWDRSIMCSDDSSVICTVNGLPTGQQVFGTTEEEEVHPETANVELYKLGN
ncbi:DUF6520 family protein [Chryseobacterium sp. Ch-15]|uniref:DUF6520 family protein n=1 Tax=Chryseobacterium muglaense TaxID=2893752 RepID=A0A9Q3V0A0_9FLAO|nr:DUF6520 family protein [Chryseobacterium muglaense]MBD3905405.1 hypothetical protein [Chryseobacterium muglaense]MCC9036870.1 DUF6520 family protein [Chryseobacterium muglaense]MCM2555268.1 DUF6520 family protein [Chryseobacterium muglaense]